MKLKSIKNFRTLHIYTQLCEGKVINKWKEATRFGVNERTIQRDIDDIRAFLSEQTVNGSANKKVEYSYEKKGFVMVEIKK